MNPNAIITLRYPVSPAPGVTLVPLPNWERVKDAWAAKGDVQVKCANGYIYLKARYWQWQVLIWAMEALKEET